MWTVGSFSHYTLMFMNKYYEGSIYLNFYLDGASGITGNVLSVLIYGPLRMRWSFLISFSITIIGIVFLLLFQQGVLSPHWISVFFRDKSPYPEDSSKDREYYLGFLIPSIVFFTKIGVNFTFLNAYQASFGDNMIFPFYKRATAIGVCNFIGRALTILAPLAAELDRPLPASILLIINVIAFINAFFLPSSN